MSTIFDVEHLQQLSYERSTKWASFLENAKSFETMDEMLISEVESFYGPEFDENDTNDELVSMEDSDCNDTDIDLSVLRNLSCNQRLSLLLPSTANTTTGVETEIVDLVNETLPILHEHNRQLKESGFDKILSTFDKKKIEEKMGSWLSRHNSLFGGDGNLLSDENKRKHSNIGQHLVVQKESSRRTRSKRIPNSPIEEESYSSDDSLQSGEIARYIRSSRAASFKNTTSNTTMIKTYRLVKSKRDALREKYACEKDNDKDYHLNARHHCRRIANSLEYHHNHYDLLKKSHNHKHEMHAVTSPAYKQRRKILRKRLVTQSYNTTGSSDSDYYDDCAEHVHRRKLPHFCNKYHCALVRNSCSAVKVSSSTVKRSQRSALKMSSARLNRIYYFSPYTLSKSLSSSTSSSSFSRPHDSNCLVKMKRKCYTAQRPCKRESECKCRNDGKLCQDFLHITDTSTEEWYVENCGTPKKMVKDHPSRAKRTLLLGKQADNYSSDNENALSDIKRQIKMKTESTETSCKSKQNEKAEKRLQKTTKIKNKTEKAEGEAKAATADDSFDRDLQKAIEMSKELFEKEQQAKVQEGKNENCKTKGRPRTQKAEHNVADNITKEQKRAARKRKTNKKENKTSDEEDVIKKSPEMLQTNGKIKVTPKDHANKHECEVLEPQGGQQIINNTTEDTFLASGRTQVICNSTAMSPNSQAYKRQITNPSVEATEGINRNIISKIKDGNNTHEDNLETKSVKNLNRKINNNSKLASRNQNQANCKDILSYGAIDEASKAREEKEENSRTTKKVKKSTRNAEMPEQSQNNFTSTGSGQSQINDSRDFSGSESSNKDNTVIFLKPTKEQKTVKTTKALKSNASISSKKDSHYDDRKHNKTNVSSTINCSNNSSTVTSTTIRSPDAPSILIQSYAKNHSHAVLSDGDVDNDALVTSTTNIEMPTLPADMLEDMREQPTTSHQAHINRLASASYSSNKGILIYSPHNHNLSLAPSSASDGYFTITKEHLSSVIGEKAAEKFLKYYIGRKRFNSNSTIYYRPPMIKAANTNISSSSDSDDELDSLGQYGDLYESLNKS